LAESGAELLLPGRDEQRGQAAVAAVTRATGRTAEFMAVNLSNQSAIRAFAARFNETHFRLDVLINDARGGGEYSADGGSMLTASR